MVATRSQTEAEKRPKRAKTARKPPPQTTAKPPPKRRKTATTKAKKKSTSYPDAEKTSAHPSTKNEHSAGGQSTVLEKGILYFFARPKVDVGDDPHGADDIQRSFLVLRPLASVDSNDDTGVAPQDAMCRILVLPKKTLPRVSKHERFLTFVKEPSISVADISEQFKAETYSTKTKGERTNPAAVPVAEAVYVLLSSQDGKVTHMAYMRTVPDESTAVQNELGIAQQGSFVAQTRNPRFPAPPQVGHLRPPEYSEEIMHQFQGKRWMPLRPEHLTYTHTEVLLIGSSSTVSRDGHEDGEAVTEVEKLEEEEQQRIEHIGEEDLVFKDLRLRKDQFAKVVDFPGTWKS